MHSDLSPIVLFVYNRPKHTAATLLALSKNKLANNSLLYVFADGLKENANAEQREKVRATREVVRSQNWCVKTIIIERDNNLGLANSIITGVSQVIELHGKAIVMEDDILPRKGFLKYMNDALNMYELDDKVGCINAWNYALDTSKQKDSTFFLKGADCWGWATWKRSWDLFESDGQKLLNEIKARKLEYSFNRNGTHDFVRMLEDQIAGRNDSWAVRWHASLFLNNKFCLWPTKSIVTNIGLDGSGIHSGTNEIEQNSVSFINVQKIEVKESEWFFNAYRKKNTKSIKFSFIRFLWNRLKLLNIREFIPPIFYRIKSSIFPTIQQSKSIWNGNYDSWEIASNLCTGYNDQLILENCKNALLKVKKNEAVYERDSVLFDKPNYSWPIATGLTQIALNKNKKLSVLDFGGSLGTTYFQNKFFLNTLDNLIWSIVEQPKFVEVGRDFFADDHLEFHFTLEESLAQNKADVLILSGVLQYLDDPEKWIKQFIHHQFEYIFIDRTGFIDQFNARILIQSVPAEIYKAAYPVWFFNEEKFKSYFLNKYDLISDFNSFCDLDTISDDGKKLYWKGFLLKHK